jgi:signal transduction histidine kinase/ligand-binding sensor domain-containing protein/DNA-binding response OmpR family regulator
VNNIVIKYFICGLILINTSFSFSQNYHVDKNLRVEHLTTEQGLSQNTVDCILKDHRGFMWFGTWNGLNLFDGYDFKVFSKQNNIQSISNNFIYSLCEDHNGNIWIATNYGLNKFEYKTNQFTHYNYNPDDPNSISSDKLQVVFFDSRNNLWIGTNGSGLDQMLTNKDGQTSFSHYNTRSGKESKITDNTINTLFEDRNGNLWIGTNNGLNCINLNNGKIKSLFSGPDVQSLSYNVIRTIYEDNQGMLWVGTEYGLNRKNKSSETFQRYYNNPDDPKSLYHSTITDITQDANNNILIGTLGGLNIYNYERDNFERFPTDKNGSYSLNNEFINSIYCDKSGIVWIGTDKGGINKYNIRQKQFGCLTNDPLNLNSLNNSIVNSIYEEGDIIWIGTAGGGLNKYNKKTNKFSHFINDPHRLNSINSDFITSICRDPDGNLLIGTWGGGVSRLISESAGGNFFHYQFNGEPNQSEGFVSGIYADRNGRIWIGSLKGLDLFNSKSGKFIRINSSVNNVTNIREVGCILHDKAGNLWVGTRLGLFIINSAEIKKDIPYPEKIRKFVNIPGNQQSISGNYIISLCEDKQGNIWIGTYGDGINVLKREDLVKDNLQFQHYTHNQGLSSDVIYCIIEDNDGLLWLSTDYGLSKLNPQTGHIRNYFMTDGLQSNQFYWSAGFKGKDGTLYFGGINGLNYFHPAQITDNQNKPPVFITDFKIFNQPVNIGKWKNKKTILQQSIAHTKVLKLSHKENVFSFEFAALNYDLPEKNQYAYMMVGVDNDWILVNANRRFASYTNLEGGEYIFKVKASNNDDIWNDEPASLKIIITPPFWKTIYFKIFLFIFLLVSIYAYLKIHTRNLKEQKIKLEKLVKERTLEVERQNEQLAHQAEKLRESNIQIEKRKELIEGQKIQLENQNKEIMEQRDKLIHLNKKVNLVNQLKLRFFTNISHEFRTPLSLIISPIEKLMEKSHENDENRNYLDLINRNAQRLLHLINQLMDFRKIEMGKMDLKVSKGDLIAFISDIFNSFNDLASQRNIKLEIFKPQSNIPTETWFDHEKIENVLYNIISNSFKYTPSPGKISLNINFMKRVIDSQDGNQNAKRDIAEISVTDTGIGIPKAQQSDIFKRFYRSDNTLTLGAAGTGIGLSVAKDLIRIHHGTIRLESMEGQGSTFIVSIPINKEGYNTREIVDYRSDVPCIKNQVESLEFELRGLNKKNISATASKKFQKDKALILVVEDNYDLREFIITHLYDKYNVIEAGDGKTALEAARIHNPDLIISDIMMPVMDGLDLCTRIKTSIDTSHIPVILLTARDSVENQIEGLETGADDYIPKPFNMVLLEARIKNLIELRKKLRLLFASTNEFSYQDIVSTSTDEKFLKKAFTVVEENIDNPKFDVNYFISYMSVSRSLLHKKLVALTDQSAVDFINSIRLKRSLQLLKSRLNNISEVAYAVGFNDPKYFSRLFRKFYGKSPSDYLKHETDKLI